MRVTRETEQFIVCDDVLSISDFRAVVSHLRVEEYRFVHADRWHKVWGLLDGAPLVGPVMYSHDIDLEGRTYPTSTALDALAAVLIEQHGLWEPRIGRHGADWRAFGMRPYLYPQGTGLTWHADELRYTGSFVYYGHEVWESGWGGELLVADPGCRIRTPDVDLSDPAARAMVQSLHAGQYTDKSYLEGKLFETGVGTYVLPRPNRLVLMAGGNYHMIKRVDPAAGDHPRCSVAGFFIR